uniref:Poly(U)-binding-splicing factor PUF60 n=2 Tax=Schistocephalus solidus TaxID=70667 RepID=A0A0X3NXC9_SCHSO
MFNVDDLAYINAYRKSVTAGGSAEPREPVIFGKETKETLPFQLITLSDDQRFAIERARKYALEQSIQNALKKQMDQLQTQDANIIKQNQALVLLSRIYVGSISFEIGEEEIRKAFSPFGPIKSIALSWDSALQKHKGFAFVEFEVPEAATLVLEQMNGFMIAGRGIKVGRPSNAPQTSTLEEELRRDPSNRNRIYVSGVHPELSESDIQTVFEAFGKVSSCTLDPDVKFGQPTRHKGYGWIEFENEQAAIDAVASMNGFELAGQLLRVGHAISPKNTSSSLTFSLTGSANAAQSQAASASAVAAAAASISARVMALDNAATTKSPDVAPGSGFSGSASNVPPPGVFIPTTIGSSVKSSAPPPTTAATAPTEAVAAPAQLPVANSVTASASWDDDDTSHPPVTAFEAPPTAVSDQSPPASSMQAPYSPSALSPILPNGELEEGVESSVILLENMVDPSELDSELEEEVSEECSKFGTVLRVLVHATDTAVRIFVHFDAQEAASAACASLNNRYFGGRLVMARLYPAEDFQMRNLDL